jgi:hypothetical protein
MMVHFRKRLNASVLKEINELIIPKADDGKPEDEDSGQDGSSSGGGSEKGTQGTLIVDATCASEDMRFPHDVTTLDEARRKTEKIIDKIIGKMPEGSNKPRTNRRVARQRFLGFIRNRKPRSGDVRRALKTQKQFVERNLRNIDAMMWLL